MFVAYYVAYTTYVVLAAVGHESLGTYSTVMLGFILPLTAVTLAVLFGRHQLRPGGGP